MVVIDGAQHAGSGSIVRQAAVLAAVTGRPVTVRNARARRPHPGLRRQHVGVLEAVRDLVGGSLEGATVGSRTVSFFPGTDLPAGRRRYDIGSAGSSTLLALSLLPLLALRGRGVEVEVHGGLFQDFAPSAFHLQQVVLPILLTMGVRAELEVVRPGYVPAGGGCLRLAVKPVSGRLQPLVATRGGALRTVWGIALASHLEGRHVPSRMASAARAVLSDAGLAAEIDERDDASATQAGAAFALFAALESGARLGADRAGAPRRRAEEIGKTVARQLLEDLTTGATVDRHAADQLIVFAALADGTSAYRLPATTDHVLSAAHLAEVFLDAQVRIEGRTLEVDGSSYVAAPSA